MLGGPVHSVQSVRAVLRSSRILTAVAVVEGGFFEIEFTSYIKAHNTCSDDVEDMRKT